MSEQLQNQSVEISVPPEQLISYLRNVRAQLQSKIDVFELAYLNKVNELDIANEKIARYEALEEIARCNTLPENDGDIEPASLSQASSPRNHTQEA